MWWYIVLLLGSQAQSHASLVGDCADGVKETAIFALHPVNHVKTAVSDAQDFQKYPDKSKEPQNNFTCSEMELYDGVRRRYTYIVYEGKAYDITEFVDSHPGGKKPLKDHAGRDATAAMKTSGMPPIVFQVFMKRFLVGRIVNSDGSQSCEQDSNENIL